MRIGILGGGQLAQMLAWAAQPLGIDVAVLESDAQCPAARAAKVVVADWRDVAQVKAFAAEVDVLTIETEQIPVEVIESLSLPCRPSAKALSVARNRIQEKSFLSEVGIAVAPYTLLLSADELLEAAASLGYPVVLKTATGGYDGKGQVVFKDAAACAAWQDATMPWPCVLEAWVDYASEVSLAAVRSPAGECLYYPLTYNEHAHGVLRVSQPDIKNKNASLYKEACAIMQKVLTALDYVGVLVLEFFVQADRLLVNEMAPRVHNSLHWSLDAAVTSQFENHMRAVAGLPLGQTHVQYPVAMCNALSGVPDLAAVCAIPGARLHNYMKAARPGRKCGHVTVVAKQEAELQTRLQQVKDLCQLGVDYE